MMSFIFAPGIELLIFTMISSEPFSAAFCRWMSSLGLKATFPWPISSSYTILASPFRPQLLGLSAVLGDAEDLARWLKAELLIDTRRPVELRKGILSRNVFS